MSKKLLVGLQDMIHLQCLFLGRLSTDYDNLIVAYNPNILINGWVGYDDNRKIENSQEKVLAKEVAINFLNKEIKKESWYKLTSKLNAIAINPIYGNIDETGIVYWFRKGSP